MMMIVIVMIEGAEPHQCVNVKCCLQGCLRVKSLWWLSLSGTLEEEVQPNKYRVELTLAPDSPLVSSYFPPLCDFHPFSVRLLLFIQLLFSHPPSHMFHSCWSRCHRV